MHTNGFIHADIKIPNVVLHRFPEEDGQMEAPILKICDFGLVQIMDPQLGNKALMKTMCGTKGYIAPEIGSYNTLVGPEIDMWSFGVMLYELCVAYKPTEMRNYRYGSGPIPFRDRDWKKISPLVIKLINECLEMDPQKRITAEEAL
jgi:protein-serine/threonine kinase